MAALSDQLSQLAEVQTANSELQGRNLSLANALRAKEEELERVLREKVRHNDGRMGGDKGTERKQLFQGLGWQKGVIVKVAWGADGIIARGEGG